LLRRSSIVIPRSPARASALTYETRPSSTGASNPFVAAGRARHVEVDGLYIEARPEGHRLVLRNRDVPGVIGQVGTILGRRGVNIAGLQLGRPRGNEHAVSIINVDDTVPADALAEVRAVKEVVRVRQVSI